MRYSTSGEQYLEISLILDIVHQQLFTNRHTPPPLVLPDVAALSCRCSEKPASSILSMLSFSHVSVKQRYFRFHCPVGRIVLIVDHPVCFPMIALWPIIRMEVMVYLPVSKFLQGPPPPIPQSFLLFTLMGIWVLSWQSSISFASDSLKNKSLSSSRWVIAVLMSSSSFQS